MATKVTGDTIALGTVLGVNIAPTTIAGSNIANNTITHSHTDSSIAKVVTLTQTEYDALASYDASTLYITTE
jgi:hypothetical protein